MDESVLSVREMQETDVQQIIEYWLDAKVSFLTNMGVDVKKIPSEDEWRKMLLEQLNKPLNEKQSYCIIWLIEGVPAGHSNVNKIIFGEEAFMHLHLWESTVRRKGYGVKLVKKTLPYFFSRLQLKKLYCEPYALNPAPNNTLEKIGFSFVKRYVTTPGWLNFEQEVNRWELSRDDFDSKISSEAD